MSRPVGAALAHALGADFVDFNGAVTAVALASTAWASVTFTGARHRLRLTLEGEGAVGAAADFLATIHDLELAVPGHIVADLALLAEERRDGGRHACLELEALTIEDC